MADCTGGTITCWISGNANIIANIANTLGPVNNLLAGGAYVLGIAFAFKAIYSLKTYSESKSSMGSSHGSLKEPMMYFMISAVLLYLPSAFSVLMVTTFGYSNVLQYAPISSNSSTLSTLFGEDSVIGGPLTIVIQTIGLVAFIRGWLIIAKGASQGQAAGGTGKGFVHVFGGMLAMNIVGTLQIINNTLYGT